MFIDSPSLNRFKYNLKGEYGINLRYPIQALVFGRQPGYQGIPQAGGIDNVHLGTGKITKKSNRSKFNYLFRVINVAIIPEPPEMIRIYFRVQAAMPQKPRIGE